jgi:PTH1 family peptidyl-tRNA hydrolase
VLVVGLGNPGSRYAGTRHNLGFEVADELARRWELPRARKRFRGLITEGRTGTGGPRVAVLLPQTYMNEAGSSAGPARGALKVPLERVVVLHDEIDLPFGEVRSKLGGGVAGHNGLRSLERGLGSTDFWRVRVGLAGHNGLKSVAEGLGGPEFRRVRIGVGRPDTTDPELVSRHVLGRFEEEPADVRELVGRAADEAERVVKEASE